jgi:hypothetical protein
MKCRWPPLLSSAIGSSFQASAELYLVREAQKEAGRVESRGRLVYWFVYGSMAPIAGGLALVFPLKSVVIPEIAIPELMAALEEVR